MCRAWVGIGLKKKDNDTIAAMRGAALNYMYQSHEKMNRDGYFFSWHDEANKVHHVRTRNYIQAMDFIESANLSNVFHGHARIASKGAVCDEFVHGWLMRGCTTSHNGTVDIDDKKYGITEANDSLQFFRIIFEKCWDKNFNTWLDNIKKFCEEGVTSGSGVFFITNSKYTLAISINKAIQVNLVNDNLLLLASQNDIHDFNDEINIRIKTTLEKTTKKLGLIELERNLDDTYTKTYEASVGLEDNHHAEFEDCILVINNANGEVVRKVDIKAPKGYASRMNYQTSMGSSTVDTRRRGQTVVIQDGNNRQERIHDLSVMDIKEINEKFFDIPGLLRKQMENQDQESSDEEQAAQTEAAVDNTMRRLVAGEFV